MLNDQMVEVFKALSDPNRLNVLELLLASDRTNSELMAETGLSQNLLSHHLTVLTEAGLVYAQQSIGDARRRYYCPNLEMLCNCKDWWQQRCPDGPLPELQRPRRVLFLCARNAARSLMAEALARHIAPRALIPFSAGLTAADGIPPVALQVLAEHQVPAHFLRPHSYHILANQPFDYLITVCDRVHEHPLPEVFAGLPYVHWSLHDPEEAGETEAEQLAAARRLFHEIEQRLALFVRRLAQEEALSMAGERD